MRDAWTWIRDFGLYGACIGTLAPLVVLVPMAYNNPGNRVIGLVVPTAVGGAAIGIAVGLVLRVLWGVAGDRPLLLSPVGFPIGAAAGGLVGAATGSLLHPSAIPVVGSLGLITGGLVLGFSWLPYLALRAVGRSGLPVVVAGGLLSPLMGIAAMVSLMASGM